jgi:hypothetical protein
MTKLLDLSDRAKELGFIMEYSANGYRIKGNDLDLVVPNIKSGEVFLDKMQLLSDYEAKAKQEMSSDSEALLGHSLPVLRVKP